MKILGLLSASIAPMMVATAVHAQPIAIERMISATRVFTAEGGNFAAVVCFEFVTNGAQYCQLVNTATEQIVTDFSAPQRAQAISDLQEIAVERGYTVLHEDIVTCPQALVYLGNANHPDTRKCLGPSGLAIYRGAQ